MHNHSKYHFVKIGLESRLAKMQTMETQGFQLLLLLLCVVPTCWGQQVYLTLGSGPSITTDNTEILITAIGENATGGLPSLTCHTDLITCCRSSDNNGNGALGQWTFPDGSVILQNGASATAGQQFYIVRGEPQVIRLARRETTNPVTPTGSYCCTVPTTGGDMTLCANLVVSPVCLSLPTLTNGVISYSDESRSDDTVATHTCNTGYTLSGGTTRTCGSGVWSGSPPTCQSDCPDLPSLTNGMIVYNAGSTDNRPLGSSAMHSCNSGYTLTGGSTRICVSGGIWNGSPPTCQSTCSDLTVPANGVIGYNMGTASLRPVDTVATYTCTTGYTLNGGTTTMTCGSDGVWSGSAPTCQTNCPDLPSLTNGMIVYSDGSPDNRPFSSSAVHSCNPGYTLTGGDTTRVCMSGGWNGSPPTCQSTCSDLTVPANGVIGYNMGTASLRPVDTVATYTCTTGYTLNGGTTTRTCGSDGVWSGSAPTCQTNCPDLPSLTNGMIVYSDGSPDNRPFSSSAVHSCNPGYTLTGGDTTRVCMSGGIWTGSPPTCQSTCSDLTVPANGMISYNMGTASLRPVDTMATFTCDTGYTLNGGTTRTCGSDGVWSGFAPTCQTNCPDLPSLTNGMIMYSDGGSTNSRPLGSSAMHSCNPGYTLTGGNTTRTCVSGGIWNGSPPTCQSTCSDLTVPANGMISYNMGTASLRPVDTVATFTCDTGYTLNGGTTRTCGSDGVWSGFAPTCLISCGPPSSITNGSPGQPTSTMIGGEAIYTCGTGYILIGSETITCLSTGNWSSSPSCQIPPPVYLSLSSTNYLSGLSEIPLSSVGEGSGLVCHTDHAGCCEGNTGDWYYPNGSVVMEDGALYVSRGQMSVSLMMSGTATAPGGVYCCVVPTSGGMSTACIVLASTDESSLCQSDNTVAVVGGAVALVVVVIAVTAVIVTYLVLRYKRGGKVTVTQDIPLTDQGQSAAAIYETVPATYEDIPASREVKGDYGFSQNNAYSM
ncbi:CUB and sushi domain-containing protein 1-like isoform X2 [Halichondria panicea]|uniref:CUB and sushi domain-containing protein 1-like isoform X2 n=1 Tax=Halichondria panicea TaxID=6063 RepID=UPI00312B73C3